MTIRVICLLRRLPGTTHQQFSDHWGKNHAKIFANLKAVKENIVRYNQFHVLPSHSKTLASIGLTVASFDGAAEFYVEKMEDLLAVFGDTEYQQHAIPDEQNFLDRSSVEILVGEDQIKYQK
ncbi:EthD domain-containing protein [Collybia nuda]|uniref:EthD domain-containing protein n=1 Tax=Collybia nuda TaxID=64659 RepID=A0A9P5XTG4_9AGAR|nr:EthD domain-containing protein [Collybia nuda]